MGGITSWSGLYSKRMQVKAAYPSIWTVPVVKKELELLLPNIREGSRVLEVGAGDRRFGEKLKRHFRNLTFKSMDIDRESTQDFYSLNEIQEEFDLIFLFEVIEHLSPSEGLHMLERLHQLLVHGGLVLVGTPNLYHPHRYFGDLTHRTPYKYEELGGVLLLAGFRNIRAHRIYNDAWLRRLFRLHLGVYLHKYLDLDFAKTVILEGRK